MSRLTLFNNPFMLGFDQLEQMFDQLSKASDDNYPPYNIAQTGRNRLEITLAVAGFSESDLNAYIENQQLVIKGKIAEKEISPDTVYLHKGIATRQFQRSFLLAEGMEIVSAKLNCGLLKIMLERNEPETRIRQIKIEEQK